MKEELYCSMANADEEEFPEHINFIERYFSHYLCDSSKLLYLQHTNVLVCVVTLSDEHEVLKACKANAEGVNEKVKVSYSLSNGVDRGNPKVSGKGKKGAKQVSIGDILCEVSIGETIIPIVTSIQASIIEVNEKLLDVPELLWSDPRGRGYIAVVLLKRPRKGKSFHEAYFRAMQLIHKAPEDDLEEMEIGGGSCANNISNEDASISLTNPVQAGKTEDSVYEQISEDCNSSASGTTTTSTDYSYSASSNSYSTAYWNSTATSTTSYDTNTSGMTSISGTYSSVTRTDSISADSVCGVGISFDATPVTDASLLDSSTTTSSGRPAGFQLKTQTET